MEHAASRMGTPSSPPASRGNDDGHAMLRRRRGRMHRHHDSGAHDDMGLAKPKLGPLDPADPKWALASQAPGKVFNPQLRHDAGPPIHVDFLRKPDPLEPTSAPAALLAFPAHRPGAKWFTDKTGHPLDGGYVYGGISYEVIYTPEEEAAMAAAESARKREMQEKLAKQLKALAKTATAEAEAGKAAAKGKRAAAAVRLSEASWAEPVTRSNVPPPGSSALLPKPALVLRSSLAKAGRSSDVERLPSPLRELARLSLSKSASASASVFAASASASVESPSAARRAGAQSHSLDGGPSLASASASLASLSSLAPSLASSLRLLELQHLNQQPQAQTHATVHAPAPVPASASASASVSTATLTAAGTTRTASASASTSTSLLEAAGVPDPHSHAQRRHHRLPRPRPSSLDPRPLKLGSYNTGETSAVSKRDLAVLAVIKASRKHSHKPTADAVLEEAEKQLLDSEYARHLVQVIEMQAAQRYVTEAEKAALREARRPKREEWRTLPP